jgi:hypothetical protein
MSQPTYPDGYDYERSLKDYRLHYKSQQYPLLAFTYAILAGGEGLLHFDYTKEYAATYLLEPYGGNLESCPPHVVKFYKQLEQLEMRTNRRTEYVGISGEEWDVFIECLAEELKHTPHTAQFW